MTIPVLTFFNNKGGVGKTSLIYHLAWMFSTLGKRVVVADLDPQANMTAAFLDEDTIEATWNREESGGTIFQCVKPLTGVGDIIEPDPVPIADNLHLIPGDVRLSGFEDALSSQWPDSMGDHDLYRSMRLLSSFWQVMQMAAAKTTADVILVDIGPNLGAINRSVLLATDYVVFPLSADLFSLHWLQGLGPVLKTWKSLWQKKLDNWDQSPDQVQFPEFQLPQGQMQPIGYLCQQNGGRLDRPGKAYDQWTQRIPGVYRQSVLDEPATPIIRPQDDPNCLGTLRHYRSLVPLAQENRKPIFQLTAADGAIGSHANAVQDAKKEFRLLAEKIGAEIWLQI
ncbi:MAG: AAA family ATPase [Pirellulaceae bacterium]